MSEHIHLLQTGTHTHSIGLPPPLLDPPPDLKRESPAEAGTSDGADLNRSGKAGIGTNRNYHTALPRATERSPGEVPATPLQEIRAEFYEWADSSADWLDYVRDHGLDLVAITAQAGVLAVCPVVFLPQGRFDFAEDGAPAAVLEAFDADGETSLDLVAWPLHDPATFATALGRAGGLGLWQVNNPATYHGGRPLPVWRTPLAWLQARCHGAVVLDPLSAPGWLASAPGLIAGEDIAHARELARLLHPYVDPSRIVAPLAEDL